MWNRNKHETQKMKDLIKSKSVILFLRISVVDAQVKSYFYLLNQYSCHIEDISSTLTPGNIDGNISNLTLYFHLYSTTKTSKQEFKLLK